MVLSGVRHKHRQTDILTRHGHRQTDRQTRGKRAYGRSMKRRQSAREQDRARECECEWVRVRERHCRHHVPLLVPAHSLSQYHTQPSSIAYCSTALAELVSVPDTA
eukprot:878452-Rhodomonas_salina.7